MEFKGILSLNMLFMTSQTKILLIGNLARYFQRVNSLFLMMKSVRTRANWVPNSTQSNGTGSNSSSLLRFKVTFTKMSSRKPLEKQFSRKQQRSQRKNTYQLPVNTLYQLSKSRMPQSTSSPRCKWMPIVRPRAWLSLQPSTISYQVWSWPVQKFTNTKYML